MIKGCFLQNSMISGFLLIFALNGFSQTNQTILQKKIADWKTYEGFKHAGIGLAVSIAGKDELVLECNPDLSLVPASIQKVVTTAAALEILGSDFQFQTRLSFSGTIRNDSLFGNLKITGGGDPTLGSEYFPENQSFLPDWTKAVKDQGIKVVSGSILSDDKIYEPQGIADTWAWEDIGNYYGAGASGIIYRDNLYDIHLSSAPEAGLPTRLIKISPEIPGLDIQNKVVSSEIKGDQTSVFGSPTERLRIIRGTIPKDQADFVIQAAMPDPKAVLARDFENQLRAAGVSFASKSENNANSKSQDIDVPIFITKSPPLADIIRVTNHESVNLFAENFLKYMACKNSGLGTTAEGCKLITRFWNEKGIDTSGLFMSDGSGLSRFNAVTARQMVQILNFMISSATDPGTFIQSLPVAGKGTLSGFSTTDFPNDCLHAKSGSMTRVRCYAGYLTTESGKKLSFVLMLNNFTCKMSEATQKITELLLEMRSL